MDPILAEILRIRRGESVRPDVVRRWQRHILDTLVPALDELETLRAEKTAARGRKKPEPVEVSA